VTTLHVTNFYHPHSGGVRTFYQAMLAAADRDGRPMRLVVPGEADRVEAVGRWGRIYHVRAPRSPVVDSRYRLLLPHTFLTGGGALARILRDEQPDLVEVCDKYALCHLAGMLRRGWIAGVRRPTLVGLSCERAVDNVGRTLGRGNAALVRWYLGRVYAGQFDVHFANSEYTAAELRAAIHPRHPRTVHVVPMGVALDGFGPEHRSADVRAEVARRTGLTEPYDLVLYAGRLAREKNLTLLLDTLRAFASVAARPTALVIAGSGPLAAELARALAFGIAPLEAMASGLPLVAPRAGGVLSYSSDANAWLAPPVPHAMARALDGALRRGIVRDRRITRAREQAASFDWGRVCRTVFALYDTVRIARLSNERKSSSC
jgi:alpha-1,6-mannosyltransferase